MGTQYSPAGTGDARHDQQLRHRLHAVGHLPDRRRELGRLLHPRRRRRRRARRQAASPRSSATAAHQGAASRHGWETGGADDKYARWNISKLGRLRRRQRRLPQRAERLRLHRRDRPVRQDRAPIKKRTALGRFAHESAAFGKLVAGKPLAVYMGDDSRNEYIYKFVSSANWGAADAERGRPHGHRRQVPRRAASCTSPSSTPTAAASGSN